MLFQNNDIKPFCFVPNIFLFSSSCGLRWRQGGLGLAMRKSEGKINIAGTSKVHLKQARQSNPFCTSSAKKPAKQTLSGSGKVLGDANPSPYSAEKMR